MTTIPYQFTSNMALPNVGDDAMVRQLFRDGLKRLEAVCGVQFVERAGGVKIRVQQLGSVKARWTWGDNVIVISPKYFPDPNFKWSAGSVQNIARHEMEHVLLNDRTEWTHTRPGEAKAAKIARVNAALEKRYGPPKIVPPDTNPPNPPPPAPPFRSAIPTDKFVTADRCAWGPSRDRVAPVDITGAAYIFSSDSYIELDILGQVKSVTIIAAGQQYNGWPVMEVSMNGKNIWNERIDHHEYRAYQVPIPGPGKLRIGMVADDASPTDPHKDRNLIVYCIGWDEAPVPIPVKVKGTYEGSERSGVVTTIEGKKYKATLGQG